MMHARTQCGILRCFANSSWWLNVLITASFWRIEMMVCSVIGSKPLSKSRDGAVVAEKSGAMLLDGVQARLINIKTLVVCKI